ncbi:MAG: hypothetical protein PW788_02795 [Micavibrio sp.]|nr:hypothetical protein [Micavibrio sp.]
MLVFSPSRHLEFLSDLPPDAAAKLLAQRLSLRAKNPDGSLDGRPRRDDGFMGYSNDREFFFVRDPAHVSRYMVDRPAITGSFTAHGAGSKITVDIRLACWMELVFYALLAVALTILYVFVTAGHGETGFIFAYGWFIITSFAFASVQRRPFKVDAAKAEELLGALFKRA